jgi:hypothetical protein
MAKFTKGQSGNPVGKPKGAISRYTRLREAIAEHVPDIIGAMVSKAREGDAQAARLLLERVIPPLKSIDSPAPLTLPVDLAAQGRAVIEALGQGTLTPQQAATVMQSIAAQARVIEVDELEQRITALEHRNERS